MLHFMHYSEMRYGYKEIVNRGGMNYIQRVDDYFNKEFNCSSYIDKIGSSLHAHIKSSI